MTLKAYLKTQYKENIKRTLGRLIGDLVSYNIVLLMGLGKLIYIVTFALLNIVYQTIKSIVHLLWLIFISPFNKSYYKHESLRIDKIGFIETIINRHKYRDFK